MRPGSGRLGGKVWHTYERLFKGKLWFDPVPAIQVHLKLLSNSETPTGGARTIQQATFKDITSMYRQRTLQTMPPQIQIARVVKTDYLSMQREAMIQFLIKLPGIHLDICLSKKSVSTKTTMMPN